jgi:nucleoside-diphosphate-sugar epimerase
VSKAAIVFGAGGAVGESAAHALIARGWQVTASLHAKRKDAAERLAQSGATIRYDDLEEPGDWPDAAARCDAILFTTHLGLTNFALDRIKVANQRIVVFSSNNVAIQPEAASYVELAAAERSLRTRHPDAAIIRPTLIYGDPRLPTLTRLMRAARRWPLLPMPGAGRALLQPIFHEDLGRAAAWLVDAAGPGTYAIGGPDSVTMRSLYKAVARAGGGKARIIPIPLMLLRLASPILAVLNLYSEEQTLRAGRDRLVVQQTPLPPEIQAKVDLKEGLARLATALGVSGSGRA